MRFSNGKEYDENSKQHKKRAGKIIKDIFKDKVTDYQKLKIKKRRKR